MSATPHILLVDDEPRFADSLESILRHYGYMCKKALTGTEAVDLLKKHRFDLALLDVALPDMSGCDIAGYIRKYFAGTVVIMLTGIRTVETAVEAMKQGAYDFLTKPLNHELLLKTLEKGQEHHRLKDQLARSEHRFRLLAEAAWEGIAFYESGMVVEANRPFMEMFGYTRDDLQTGLQIEALLGSGNGQAFTGGDSVVSGKSSTKFGRKKDGSIMPVEIRSCSMDNDGMPVRALVVRDLTERIQAEQKALELQKKLAEANKLNALGLMAGQVAHDLNNILTGIVSYPDLLLMQMDKSDKHYEQIEKIQAAGKRAAAVVSDLVAITRGKNQQKTVENINDLVVQYLNSLEHGERLALYSEVAIETSLRMDILNVCCSTPHIHKVLLNLIGNALEAVKENGIVRISTENCHFNHPMRDTGDHGCGNEYVKLVVADNGPGIDDKDIDHIFNPFYSTKVMGKSGTGLGLSVVWNIIQDHGGWIEVKDNRPGAAFEIYLPATRDQVCQTETPAVDQVGRGSGERILIVDDQAEQNEVLEIALSGLGYTAYSVTSGEEAIEFVKSEPVDLLLMDMIMGAGMNGRETLEAIFRNNPAQKAIVVSGYAKREEIEKTRDLGVSLFLEKPITLAKISAAIQQTLAIN